MLIKVLLVKHFIRRQVCSKITYIGINCVAFFVTANKPYDWSNRINILICNTKIWREVCEIFCMKKGSWKKESICVTASTLLNLMVRIKRVSLQHHLVTTLILDGNYFNCDRFILISKHLLHICMFIKHALI